MSGISYDLAIPSGKLGSRYRTVYKFGHNEDAGTSPEDVWENGGTYPWQTAAQTLEAISTSANDAAAGTGIRTVRVFGLDANFNEIDETITMNGTNASAATTQSFLRVFRAYGVTCGSGGEGAGTITIRVSGGGSAQAVLEYQGSVLHMGQTQMAIYTVPAGYRAYLVAGSAGVESNKSTDLYMMHRTYDDANGWGPWRLVESGLGLGFGAAYDIGGAVSFGARSDLKVVSLGAAINTRVTASFSLLLEAI